MVCSFLSLREVDEAQRISSPRRVGEVKRIPPIVDMAMSGWTSSNGLTNSIGYDSDLRPTGISVPNVESLGFTYDLANRITHITNGINASLTQVLGYDALDRLTTIASTVDNESYTYDANGNRTHKVLNGHAISITIASDSNRLLVSGGTTCGYDADGNVLTANITTLFHYDPFGREKKEHRKGARFTI
jgi:YD repeat-containing protein